MRKLLAASAIVAALFGMLGFCAPACAPKNPAVTAHGQALLNADAVVLRLGELGDTAIAANKSGALADGPAIKIAKFVRAGVETAKVAPDGWQPALRAFYASLRDDIGALVGAKLGTAWSVIDALLGGS